MFRTLLIANRGEIACRVIRTARRLGLKTVAVYSDADRAAMHVMMADETCRIGPALARDSYLNIGAVIDAAKRSGAEAIHPGYGFLSENATFAEACATAGIVFVGPPVAAIRAMGSKSAAKSLMEKAGVPLVPGYHGADQRDGVLQQAADSIGYPLLVKASAGGGGKGMRRVDRQADFAGALTGARREAKAAFGDDSVLIEKYLLRPRHIEMQVFADSHGNVVHLFERDCSIQRRHQKIIEEAPAPGMSDARRRKMGKAAIAAARAVGYVGAGTVEFIVDEGGAFHFMEMNTRLQVEHPVTEMITGLDLVEWQLRIAAGEHLPLEQPQIVADGHAIEVRLYAEDPQRDFLPMTGRLLHLRFPPESPHLRIDTGVRAGDDITIHYDPMLAKLIAHGGDRSVAVARLVASLAGCQVAGVTTNLALLAAVARHPSFAAGDMDTGFIERHHQALFAATGPVPDEAIAVACLAHLLRRAEAAAGAARKSDDPYAPWHAASGWRLNLQAYDVLHWRDGVREVVATVQYGREDYRFDFSGRKIVAAGELLEGGDLLAEIDGRRSRATVVAQGTVLTLFMAGASYVLERIDALALAENVAAPSGRLTAPMSGRVVATPVAAGSAVKRGDVLMVIEAMKMEHSISAPADGALEALHYAAGDLVEDGVELLAFRPAAGDGRR